MKLSLSVDLEQDCPPYLESWRGVEEGVPKLLELFSDEAVPVTFFSTGEVARRHPRMVERLVGAGYELGCHGDTHACFATLSQAAARTEIARATETLRRFYPVTCFRAPYLRFPDRYLSLLVDAGYQLDSSQAKHKSPWVRSSISGTLTRLPVSTTSSVLRLPPLLRHAILARLRTPVVLFVHPWEFVDLRRQRLRFDCRFGTGAPAVTSLRETIHRFRARGWSFHRIADFRGAPNVDGG